MNNTHERSYGIKDADMLLTASTIVKNALSQKEFLQQKRSVWKDAFFEELQKRIDHAIQTNLGFDSAKDLREATLAIHKIQKEAVRDLAQFKVQFVEDFKKDPLRRNEVLTQLGFNLYTEVRAVGNQQEVVGLLYQFKTNMSEALKKEIVDKGTSVTLIEGIIKYADFLHGANVTQEGHKGARKQHTKEAVTELNDLYSDIMSVCKIASKFYPDEPLLKELFSFNKISKGISGKLLSTKAKKASTADLPKA